MRKVAAIVLGIGFVAAVLLNKRTAVVNGPPETATETEVQAAVPFKTATAKDVPAEEAPDVGVIEIPRGGNPKTTFGELMRMDPGAARLNAMVRLAGVWAQQNPREAAETFLAQTSGSERARGVAQAVSVWAKNDPAAALKWLSETSVEPAMAGQVRKQLYATWAVTHPTAAVESAIAGGFIGPELNAVFGAWATVDLEEAVKYQDEKLPANLQKQMWPVLLLTAAAQKSDSAESLFEDFLASRPTASELLAIGKTLSATDPHMASLAADHLPASEAEILRRRIKSLHPDFSQTVAGISDTQEASIPAASPRVISAGAEPANSLPR